MNRPSHHRLETADHSGEPVNRYIYHHHHHLNIPNPLLITDWVSTA